MTNYEPVIIDIETTGLNPMAQEWHNGEQYDAAVSAVAFGLMPNWREASSVDELTIHVKTISDDDEYHLLNRLPTRVSSVADNYYGESSEAFFVGHNIREYDFPYLGARFARKRLNGEPFNSEWKRLDTMRVARNDDTIDSWYVSEDDYCDHLGISVDDPYDGGDMPDAYENGEWDKIHKHVTSDVRANCMLFFKRRELCMEVFNDHYDDVDINPTFVDEVQL